LKVYKEKQDNEDDLDEDSQLKDIKFKNTLDEEDGVDSRIKITGINDLPNKPLI